MAPSHSDQRTPSMAPSPAPQRISDQEQDKDALEELRSNGKWAAGITILSFMYGDLTVASQLPPDPRQHSWLLMKSPYPALIASLLYIAVVTWWGPLYMRSKQPVSGLKRVMIVYNAFQVVFSTWIFYEGGMSGWFNSYKLFCQPCDFSDNPQATRMLNIVYWYFFSKFIDFIDTVFFVLNKKHEHISLLHVTHHSLMPSSVWFGVLYQPGGHSTFMGFLNAFVHAVMYSYYLLAAMGPRVRPFLWWKKYLTTLQMVQFTAIFFHSLSLMFLECDVPSVFVRWLCGFAALFFILFTDFYIKAYRKRGKDQGEARGNGRRDYLTNMCYIGAPVGLINGMSNNVPKQMTNDIFHSSSSDIANGVTKRSPNSIPEDSSNGEPVGASLYVPQHLPPHLQENMRLRNLIRQ
ncbi:very long chain fatty acid elongase 7 [Procambarus clarkii]|uniref:very long chain fatty acid elongase 7 n=1 Tax=Procambarus clarkii TaxID=6728 RepID=UPI001E676095|nr:elongation of very long chain fatty acids protein-like [Procambarus clarkii]XP_045608803.1 elongation of very long chain fatty acids protein-like [Procambarus clarkii]